MIAKKVTSNFSIANQTLPQAQHELQKTLHFKNIHSHQVALLI